MKDKKLLFHPGSPKAGSTLIQNFSINNRENLARQGMQYFHGFRDLDFLTLANGNEEAFYKNFARLFPASEISDATNSFFLSFENVFGDPLFKEGLFALAPAITEKLLPVLDSFSEVRVVWVARRLDSFLLSAYNQRRKQGSKMTFEGFSKMIEERDYQSNFVLDALKILSRSADITVLDFEMLQDRPRRFLSNFFAKGGVGISNDFDFTKPARNPSVRDEGLQILQFAKDVLPAKEFMELRKFCQEKFAKDGYTELETQFIEAHKSRFDEDAAWFRNEVQKFAEYLPNTPRV